MTATWSAVRSHKSLPTDFGFFVWSKCVMFAVQIAGDFPHVGHYSGEYVKEI